MNADADSDSLDRRLKDMLLPVILRKVLAGYIYQVKGLMPETDKRPIYSG